MQTVGRPGGRFFCFCVFFALLATVSLPSESWAAPPKTSVNDVLYRADGSPARGTVTIRWSAFTASDGSSVAAGILAVKIGANGSFGVQLIPNTAAKPEGSYYKVVMKLDDGTTSEEAWAVPAVATTTVAAVRATVMPASVATQYVGRDYVDTAVAAAAGNGVQTTGSYSDPTWLSSLSSSKLVGVLPAGALPASVASTNAQNTFTQPQTFANINGCRYAGQVGAGTIQAAIDDAGTSGCVIIPKSYAGTDSFRNSNSIAIVDFRRGASMNGMVNVLDYGADATGVNDSQPAFQAATNLGRGCVFIPAGTYKLATPVRYGLGPVCFTGEPSGGYNGQKTILKPTTAAFAPASPLSYTVDQTYKNFQINGGTNGIELNLDTETFIENVGCYDYSGWCIVHVNGERHHWSNVMCQHTAVSAQGCISSGDPTVATDAATYAANGYTPTSSSLGIDRGEFDHIRDFGQPLPGAQDNWFMRFKGNGAAHMKIVHPTVMWAGKSNVFEVDGWWKWSTVEDPTFDIIGSQAAPAQNFFYVSGSCEEAAWINFSPADAPAAYYVNGINLQNGCNNGSVISSNLGGDGSTSYAKYGLYLGANPVRPTMLISSSGYVYLQNATGSIPGQSFGVIGGAVSSNYSPIPILNPAGLTTADQQIYFGPPNGVNNNYTGTFSIRRFYGGVVSDLSLGATSSSIRTPFTMQGGASVTGNLSATGSVAATGALSGASLAITGCGAGTYAKADGSGCGTPGSGTSGVVAHMQLTGQSGQPSGVVYTATTAGTYRLSLTYYTQVTATSSNINVAVGWNTGYGTYNNGWIGQCDLSSASSVKSATFVVHLGANQSITYSTSLTTSGSPQYGLDAVVEQLQ